MHWQHRQPVSVHLDTRAHEKDTPDRRATAAGQCSFLAALKQRVERLLRFCVRAGRRIKPVAKLLEGGVDQPKQRWNVILSSQANIKHWDCLTFTRMVFIFHPLPIL
jgi:hypothetical protein